MGEAAPDAGGIAARRRAALEAFLLGEEPSLTRVEVAERAGVPLDLAVTLWHQLGFPHRADDDVAFAESDVEALRLTADLVRIGHPAAGVAGRARPHVGPQLRPARRVADQPARRARRRGRRDPAARLTELAADVLPRVEALQTYVWRRHLASAASTCSTTPSALTSRRAQMAVCFVDIVGYTTQSRSLDGAELVAVGRGLRAGHHRRSSSTTAARSSRPSATRSSSPSPTRPRPWRSPSTLTARGADEDDPFPAVRAGIAHGAVVRRLGDVFGSTVNIASRLTSAARPGTVLVDAGVHEALTADEDGRRADGGEPTVARRRSARRSALRLATRRVPAKGFSHL